MTSDNGLLDKAADSLSIGGLGRVEIDPSRQVIDGHYKMEVPCLGLTKRAYVVDANS